MSTSNTAEILEKLEWGKYVSPLSDKNRIPFNWYAFKHRFGSELASEIFNMFNLSKGDTILDPFCGGGTTLIRAKQEGYNAIGLDISPFSVFLTNALTKKYNPKSLRKKIDEISHEINPNVAIPDVAILNKAFSDNTLKYIYTLRESINTLRSPARDFFLFSLLSILNEVSKAKKAGGFLRITNQRKVPLNVVKRQFIEASNKFINDMKHYDYSDTKAEARLGDARDYPTDIGEMKFDGILTSPPYPNRHDYTRIYGLELLVGFIENNQALKNLRYETLRSHVEAKKQYEIEDYEIPQKLQDKIDELSKCELNNARIIPTLDGYFEDMYLCLRQMSNVLKLGGRIGLVVSNVRFAGIMIPVDELLAEIGEQVGLGLETIYVLRFRGNSAQQMLKHKRVPTRESLIIWKK